LWSCYAGQDKYATLKAHIMLWIKGPARAQKQPAKIKKKIMKKQIVEFA